MVKIFIAGPVNATESVRKLMPNFKEIGHREPEFQELFKSVKDNLFKLFRVNKKEFDIAILGGSGTSAMESTISSVVTYPLIISNGAFGERMHEICKVYQINHFFLKYDWGVFPNLKEIEDILKKNPHISDVAMIYMETSTGMLNPLKEVGKLCKKYNKRYIVDAVCAIVGEELDMNKNHIDFCFASSNKGIGGPPVMGMVCCRKSKLNCLKKRNLYLDLSKYLDYGKDNQTPFTPAIILFYLMNETLKEVLKEGLDNKIKRHQECTKLLRKELKKLGLSFYLKEHMSNIMTNVIIPKDKTFKEIHDHLKDKGFLIYPGKDSLKHIMHIATLGTIKLKDVKEFIQALKEII